MITQEEKRRAIHRIKAKQQLMGHVFVFMAVAAYFVFLWAQSDADSFWPIWALFGWGIGLGAHAISVLGWSRPISENRIEREVTKYR